MARTFALIIAGGALLIAGACMMIAGTQPLYVEQPAAADAG